MGDMTITEFLEARIAEDEALAQTIQERGEWRGIQVNAATETAVHVERWHPARVLAECAAKRAILEVCDDGGPWPSDIDRIHSALAAVYADHPDYRDEWIPNP